MPAAPTTISKPPKQCAADIPHLHITVLLIQRIIIIATLVQHTVHPLFIQSHACVGTQSNIQQATPAHFLLSSYLDIA